VVPVARLGIVPTLFIVVGLAGLVTAAVPRLRRKATSRMRVALEVCRGGGRTTR
jgi:hypothetical protein